MNAGKRNNAEAGRFMDKTPIHENLLLPDLAIKGFRGISDLSISRLGRVTLIAGLNGTGKTTILDAVQVFAARGNHAVLASILNRRSESVAVINDDGDEIPAPDVDALFYGRNPSADSRISIGRINYGLTRVVISPSHEASAWQETLFSEDSSKVGEPLVIVKADDKRHEISMSLLARQARLVRRRFAHGESERSSELRCEFLGPSIADDERIAQLLDRIALTPAEPQAMDALRPMCGDEVEGVRAVINDNRRPYKARKLVVKMKEYDSPVPLRSLGDGAVRMFAIAAAIANCKDGFLLIDEVENGIHYSVQPDFWRMALQAANENNAQIFATTHSWDCVESFAQALGETEDADGALVRIEKRGDAMRAVEYSAQDLQIVAEQGIEVR